MAYTVHAQVDSCQVYGEVLTRLKAVDYQGLELTHEADITAEICQVLET